MYTSFSYTVSYAVYRSILLYSVFLVITIFSKTYPKYPKQLPASHAVHQQGLAFPGAHLELFREALEMLVARDLQVGQRLVYEVLSSGKLRRLAT